MLGPVLTRLPTAIMPLLLSMLVSWAHLPLSLRLQLQNQHIHTPKRSRLFRLNPPQHRCQHVRWRPRLKILKIVSLTQFVWTRSVLAVNAMEGEWLFLSKPQQGQRLTQISDAMTKTSVMAIQAHTPSLLVPQWWPRSGKPSHCQTSHQLETGATWKKLQSLEPCSTCKILETGSQSWVYWSKQ